METATSSLWLPLRFRIVACMLQASIQKRKRSQKLPIAVSMAGGALCGKKLRAMLLLTHSAAGCCIAYKQVPD
jgi:hypothetical protein